MTYLSTLARAARLGAARKRGVTLIEAVLYISIALALIVGGLVFFQQASLAQRTNSAVRNISAIASETRGLYQQQNSFDGLGTLSLINAGAVPSSLIVGSGSTATLRNEWGGTIVVAPNDAITVAPALPEDAGFTVTYPGLPTAACVRLTSTDASGTGRVGSGIRSISFKAGGSGSFSTEVLPGNLDPDEVAAAALCGQSSGVADVRFTFFR